MIDQNKKYLLILPCSKKKKQVSVARAIELYNGPFYQIIRKNYKENVDIFIISAKYGLINSNDFISLYDQMMTNERAKELSETVKIDLEKILQLKDYDEIFISLGKTYMGALEESKDLLDNCNVSWGYGQIGERLHQLKTWLTAIEAEDKTFL